MALDTKRFLVCLVSLILLFGGGAASAATVSGEAALRAGYNSNIGSVSSGAKGSSEIYPSLSLRSQWGEKKDSIFTFSSTGEYERYLVTHGAQQIYFSVSPDYRVWLDQNDTVLRLSYQASRLLGMETSPQAASISPQVSGKTSSFWSHQLRARIGTAVDDLNSLALESRYRKNLYSDSSRRDRVVSVVGSLERKLAETTTLEVGAGYENDSSNRSEYSYSAPLVSASAVFLPSERWSVLALTLVSFKDYGSLRIQDQSLSASLSVEREVSSGWSLLGELSLLKNFSSLSSTDYSVLTALAGLQFSF